MEQIKDWWFSLDDNLQIKLLEKYFPGSYVVGVWPADHQLQRMYEGEMYPEGIE